MIPLSELFCFLTSQNKVSWAENLLIEFRVRINNLIITSKNNSFCQKLSFEEKKNSRSNNADFRIKCEKSIFALINYLHPIEILILTKNFKINFFFSNIEKFSILRSVLRYVCKYLYTYIKFLNRIMRNWTYLRNLEVSMICLEVFIFQKIKFNLINPKISKRMICSFFNLYLLYF